MLLYYSKTASDLGLHVLFLWWWLCWLSSCLYVYKCIGVCWLSFSFLDAAGARIWLCRRLSLKVWSSRTAHSLYRSYCAMSPISIDDTDSTTETFQVPLDHLPTHWDDRRLLLFEPFLTHFASRSCDQLECYSSRRTKKEDEMFYESMWVARGDMVSWVWYSNSLKYVKSEISIRHTSNGLGWPFKGHT